MGVDPNHLLIYIYIYIIYPESKEPNGNFWVGFAEQKGIHSTLDVPLDGSDRIKGERISGFFHPNILHL